MSACRRSLLLCTMAAVAGYFSGSHPEEHRVSIAAQSCLEQLGHALGPRWYGCVVDELKLQQQLALAEGRKDFFPVAPHTFDPWQAERGNTFAPHSDLLKNLLRNFSCDVEDGGTAPLRSMTWEYQPPDPCGSVTDAMSDASLFVYKAGFLPAGDDLPELGVSNPMTESQAEAVCAASPQCQGYTFHERARSEAKRVTVHFKSFADNPGVDE